MPPDRSDDRAHDEAPAARTGYLRLADQTVATAAVRQAPDRYTRLFEAARNQVGHARCLCRIDEVVRLVIRCRSGRYHLANWPSGGHQHAPDCPWFRAASSLSGRSAYADAIADDDDGTSIRLSSPLVIRGASAGGATTTGRGSTGREPTAARGAVGLLGLVHYLWEAARLNVWSPQAGRRHWPDCHDLLREQARDCRINHLPLAGTLWIVPPFRPADAHRINTAWERYFARLAVTGTSRRRSLLLGEIRALEPTTHSIRVKLAHQRTPLYAPKALVDRVRRSYPAAFTAQAAQTNRRRVLLGLIEHSPRGHAVLVDFAAMLTTATYLPADSSHEADMADALTAAARTFLKPLRYDRNSQVFPDFVLVDDEPETYVEVWGVLGRESYESRKRAKQTFYRTSGKSLIEWDVRTPIPDLTRQPPNGTPCRPTQSTAIPAR
ncbi:DUF1173 family protein [Actinokineospora iranica]|uniref:DUF1173 domain-containing protein n=1 Tax=Actinokineospora iranica TaxID=1271860 RepID=A0A1G6WSZ9_9PSEU|nr:DUF1173 family protein [Actinokineospora iranica]SDD68941.1 Protein of unknown function [Actinokineospora iranica]